VKTTRDDDPDFINYKQGGTMFQGTPTDEERAARADWLKCKAEAGKRERQKLIADLKRREQARQAEQEAKRLGKSFYKRY
jgi:hypothetical protein